MPVAGVAGDQQAALFGQACVDPGLGQEHVRDRLVRAPERRLQRRRRPCAGLLSTVAWGIGERLSYALEAAIFVTGAAVQWLRDGLGIIADAAETGQLAASLPSNDGVYFVPALTGLGSPHWDPYARGTIVGLTRGSTRAHLARATLEAIAYQTVDAVRAMEAASGVELAELRADGGATANDWLMQFQADVLGVPVVRAGDRRDDRARAPRIWPASATGLWTIDQVRRSWRERRRYEPAMGDDQREALLHGLASRARAVARLGRGVG